MEDQIKELVRFVRSSLYMCNKAFDELWHITQTPSTESENDIVMNPPFHFYGVTLQYCLIMEYMKLLDTNSTNADDNVASLYKLNNAVYKYRGNSYEQKFLENKKLLSAISKSALYNKLRTLRNKKFGHSENHEVNDPMKFKGFSGQELDEIKVQLKILLTIANNCFGAADGALFLIPTNTQTANFIRHHAKYKQYYYKNFMKALEEGYGL